MRERRAALSPQQRLDAAQAVYGHLQDLPALRTCPAIAGYWAVQGELPLHPMVHHCLRSGQAYLLPKLKPNKCLVFAPFRPGDAVAPNRYGVPEPADGAQPILPQAVPLVLVPLLAFDRTGTRLGTGGGYYDRSFAFLREPPRGQPAPLLVGIAYAFQEVPALERAEWDVPLDAICTERELFCVPRGARPE